MKQAFFKVLNASFISGTFVYYMLTEKYPHIVIQALTYQVQSGFKCILYSFLFQGLLLLSLYTISELLESFIPSLKRMICFLFYNTTCDVLSRPDDKPPPHLLPCRHPHLGAVLGPRNPRGPQVMMKMMMMMIMIIIMMMITGASPPSRITSSTASTPRPASSPCWCWTRSGGPAASSSPSDMGSPMPWWRGSSKVQVAIKSVKLKKQLAGCPFFCSSRDNPYI